MGLTSSLYLTLTYLHHQVENILFTQKVQLWNYGDKKGIYITKKIFRLQLIYLVGLGYNIYIYLIIEKDDIYNQLGYMLLREFCEEDDFEVLCWIKEKILEENVLENRQEINILQFGKIKHYFQHNTLSISLIEGCQIIPSVIGVFVFFLLYYYTTFYSKKKKSIVQILISSL